MAEKEQGIKHGGNATLNCKSCGAEIILCDRCWSVCTDLHVVAGIGKTAYVCCHDCIDDVERQDQEWWEAEKKARAKGWKD